MQKPCNIGLKSLEFTRFFFFTPLLKILSKCKVFDLYIHINLAIIALVINRFRTFFVK